MAQVSHKTEVDLIDGTPVKRMFLSIISDYDLKTGLCELVDNALDQWRRAKEKAALSISVVLDSKRQLISVSDNAGGVKREDLHLLISPGGSGNDRSAELIGTFGVGSKRAGIALGERLEIRSRHGRKETFELDVTNQWLESEDWHLPAYQIPNIGVSTTQVDISVLRKPFSDDDIEIIQKHLGETYEWYIRKGCSISLNGTAVKPVTFDKWAFPKGQSPRRAIFEGEPATNGKLKVSITGGLIRDRDPELENYGVYIYCNNRLIVKELRDREVGYYVTGEAGVPHPDASLCRVIVRLDGPAELMPWNSSKSGINYSHQAFQLVRPTLIQLTTHFSSLSRRLKSDWDGKVFNHKEGEIERIEPSDATVKNPLILPNLPRVNKPRAEKLKSRNKTQIKNQPWTLGLVEAMAAVEIITRQKLETKNRTALILLDSNFEIALKEFIVHRHDLFPPSQFGDSAILRLFRSRPDVITTITAQITIPQKLLDKANHYYGLRNKLIHERATVGITDSDIENYRATVAAVLKLLFKLNV